MIHQLDQQTQLRVGDYAHVHLPVEGFSKNNINDDDDDDGNNNNQQSHAHHRRRRRRRLVVQLQAIEISNQPNNNFPHGALTDTDYFYIDTLLAINLGFNIYSNNNNNNLNIHLCRKDHFVVGEDEMLNSHVPMLSSSQPIVAQDVTLYFIGRRPSQYQANE